MRLLIVDDTNMIRTRISRVVQGGGLPPVSIVGLAHNGVEAVRLARETQPEVVAMDLTMPEMDGAKTIAAITRLRPQANILVVGALADQTTARQAVKLGARGFVFMPFSDQELQLALLDVCEPH